MMLSLMRGLPLHWGGSFVGRKKGKRLKRLPLCLFWSHQKDADSQGSVRMNLIQKGGTDENSSRSVEMSPGDASFGVEGDDDTRAGRRVMVGDAVLGDFDGTRAEISGIVCHYPSEIQEEMKQASGKFLGADRRSGQEWASGRDLGWPKISLPVLGLVYRAAFCPVSSIRALFDGLHLLEHTCSKPKKTDLLSKSLVISPSLAPTFAYPENGQQGNAINIGEVAELREDDDQEYGYKPMNMHGLGQDCLSNSRFKGFAQDKTSTSIFVHKDREKDPRLFNDKERYYPHLMLYSSTSSLCLDWIPHLGESFGHGGPDKTPHDTEECVGSQGIAITPLAILPPSSPTRSLCRDLAAVEEREVQQCEDGDKDENRGKEILVEDTMSWEESCLARFSKFLGFSTSGHEEEILEFLKRFNVGRRRGKGKGGNRITKFDREMKKLAWNVTDTLKKKDGGLGKETRAYPYSRG